MPRAEQNDLHQVLHDVLAEVAPSPKEDQYSYFLKLDVSGIQEFVFHVQSDKAARSLKGRSFFVHAIGLLAERWLRDRYASKAVYTLYNGGGNLYMLLADGKKVDALQAELNRQLWQLPITACLSGVAYTGDFKNAKQELEARSARDKARKFRDYPPAFAPFLGAYPTVTPEHQQQHWDDFTRNLIRKQKYRIEADPKQPGDTIEVGSDQLRLLGYRLKLDGNATDDEPWTSYSLRSSILANLPTWPEDWITAAADDSRGQLVQLVNDDYRQQDTRYTDGSPKRVRAGDVIEFIALAAQAGQRTGTPKLGILKMDVDNLGRVFDDLPDLSTAARLSAAYSWFFDQHFFELWQEPYAYQHYWKNAGTDQQECRIRDNLYVVFAGGDDCFLVGAWDIILEFAERLHTRFEAFVTALKAEIPELAERTMTLSGGITLVGPKFPTIRFAKEADEALDAAKHYACAKNRITLLGEELVWKDYGKTRAAATQVAELVREELVKRSLPQRLIQSGYGMRQLKRRSEEEDLPPPRTWRLQYFVGKQKKAKSPREIEARRYLDELMQDYAKALLAAFNAGRGTTHMVYPLAGRLAEFITKKAKLTGNE